MDDLQNQIPNSNDESWTLVGKSKKSQGIKDGKMQEHKKTEVRKSNVHAMQDSPHKGAKQTVQAKNVTESHVKSALDNCGEAQYEQGEAHAVPIVDEETLGFQCCKNCWGGEWRSYDVFAEKWNDATYR